jgi:hypothetical protein
MVNSHLSGLEEDIANKLSNAVLSKASKDAPPILANSYDLFVRNTEGGKQVMSKLSMSTLLPAFALGFLAGWIIKGKRK